MTSSAKNTLMTGVATTGLAMAALAFSSCSKEVTQPKETPKSDTLYVDTLHLQVGEHVFHPDKNGNPSRYLAHATGKNETVAIMDADSTLSFVPDEAAPLMLHADSEKAETLCDTSVVRISSRNGGPAAIGTSVDPATKASRVIVADVVEITGHSDLYPLIEATNAFKQNGGTLYGRIDEGFVHQAGVFRFTGAAPAPGASTPTL